MCDSPSFLYFEDCLETSGTISNAPLAIEFPGGKERDKRPGEVFEEITLAEHFPNMGRKQSSKYRKLGESHIVLTQGGTC